MKGCLIMLMSLFFASQILAQEIILDNITEAKALKRGKKYNIKWTGIDNSTNHQLRLEKNDEVFYVWKEQPIYGVYHVKIKNSIKPGNEYRLYTVNTISGERSAPYLVDIKRRVPLVYQTVGSVLITLSAIMIYQSTRYYPYY